MPVRGSQQALVEGRSGEQKRISAISTRLEKDLHPFFGRVKPLPKESQHPNSDGLTPAFATVVITRKHLQKFTYESHLLPNANPISFHNAATSQGDHRVLTRTQIVEKNTVKKRNTILHVVPTQNFSSNNNVCEVFSKSLFQTIRPSRSQYLNKYTTACLAHENMR